MISCPIGYTGRKGNKMKKEMTDRIFIDLDQDGLFEAWELLVIVWGHDLLWLAKTNEKQGNCYCPKGLVEHGAVVAGNRWDNPELMKEESEVEK